MRTVSARDQHARFYPTSTGLQITAPLVDLPYPLNIIVALDRIWPADLASAAGMAAGGGHYRQHFGPYAGPQERHG
jgi:hypothetical protein